VRILAAAQELFVDRGLDVGVDEIARRAGVGMGTLYRRFPNKDALIEAILRTAVDDMRELAVEVTAKEPPEVALQAFLVRVVVSDPCRGAFLSQHLWSGRTADSMFGEVVPLVAEMFAAAQRAGSVRPDARIVDLLIMMRSMRVVLDLTEKSAPGFWKRALDIILAGLRPDARNNELPLPTVPLDHLMNAAVTG